MATTPAGRVTLCSPDHVSLLVHRTFNVSIPRHHIPTDQWEFEYGPAENDPEFGNVESDDVDVDATADAQATDQRGRWVHRVTGNRLGGKHRWLQFTVVG
jgi:DNA-directed RNA polymerase I subunit RPA43